MANLFRSIPLRKPRKNFFDLSHEVLTTTSMGVLTPFFCEPVVPGDRFKVQTEILCRMAPSLAPIMARVNVYTHFFFVPNRLVWDAWEDFITRGASGVDAPVYPTYRCIEQSGSAVTPENLLKDNINGSYLCGKRSLVDYLGFQPLSSSSSTPNHREFDALPLRAYQLIYDEYYRDQSLESPVCASVEKRDGDPIGASQAYYLEFGSGQKTYTRSVGPTGASDQGNAHWSPFRLHRRAWEKDYFTSALPWPQRGADVNIPFGSSSAPVVLVDNQNAGYLRCWDGVPFPAESGSLYYGNGKVPSNSSKVFCTSANNSSGTAIKYDPNGTLNADLSNAVGATINDLRRSIKLQEFYEKDARGGSRYIEKILSHFGVRSSDARLQRPEYLGGGVSPIVVSEVLQQSQSTADSPLGQMGGHGISAQVTHQFKRRFEEHGFIIGIISIMPKPLYMQGTPRKFLKRDFFDFYWPEFANLGEQPIYRMELYTYDTESSSPLDSDTSNAQVFGYTPRYAEYKYSAGHVSGDFRDNLSFWHLGRNLTSQPLLGYDFIYEPPTTRIFAVTDEYVDHFWLQIYNKVSALRPMPKFGVPII